MLELTKFINKGETRICFEHPLNNDKCVKVALKHKNEKDLLKEICNYFMVKNELSDHIVCYESQCVQTNFGKGVVCDLLRDDNGKISNSLAAFLQDNGLDQELSDQLYHFIYCLLEHNICFYDFNLKNFVVQIKDGRKNLYYTDLKSLNNYKSWSFLKLEKIIPSLAKYLMVRRIKRLLIQLKMV